MRSTLAALYFWGTTLALFSRGGLVRFIYDFIKYALSTNFSRARGTRLFTSFFTEYVPCSVLALASPRRPPTNSNKSGAIHDLPSPCLTLGVAPTPKTIQPTAPPTHSSVPPTLSASVPWPPYHPLTRPHSPKLTSLRRDPHQKLCRPPRGPPRHHLCPRETSSVSARLHRHRGDFTCAISSRAAMATAAVATAAVPAAARV